MARTLLLAGVAWLVLLAPVGTRAAAPAGDPDRLFGLTNVWTIHLTLTASNWASMMPEEPQRGGGFGGPGGPGGLGGPVGPVGPGGRGPLGGGGMMPGPGGGPGVVDRDYPWSVCDFEGAGVAFTNVAIRFKGNSSFAMSRRGLKRPLRLDFNRGAKGRTWLGVEEVSLNNNLNDATQFREALAYEVHRRAGLAAPRTAFARVYLTVTGERTNAYAGLYTLVETVEGDFLRSHFATKKGLLLKPERLRGLEYLGEDWKAYPARYEPKSDVKRADSARFIALTRLVAQADDATFARELPGFLDVDGFLRFVAVTAWVGNYDSFVGNGHNYYLFQPADGGRAVFVPWDLNESFGGHPGAGPRREQAGFSILRPQGAPNRLIERVLANPTWMTAYRRELERLGREACEPGRLVALSETLAATVREAVSAESDLVRAAFERVALGGSNPGAGPGGPANEGPPRGPRDGFGPRPGAGEDGTLADWIRMRARNVAEELAGTRKGTVPPTMRGPGGPGGPGGARRPGGPQLGGPGGLVPPPGR